MIRAVGQLGRLMILISCLRLPSASPACAGSGAAPVLLGEPLSFCGLAGMSCCDAAADAVLRERLRSLNVSDAACAAIIKGIICQRCLPSLPTELFNAADPTSVARSIPRLCASAPSPSSFASHPSSKSAQGKARPGLTWLLSFGACALALAFYQVYMKLFAGGGQPAMNVTNNITNNTTTIMTDASPQGSPQDMA